MKHHNIIVWDLGATKCAAALVSLKRDSQKLVCEQSCTLPLKAFDSLQALIIAIEERLNYKHRDADAICIGAAGIFDGHRLHLDKGYPIDLPIGDYAHAMSWPPWAIVHDYTPILCATFVEDIKSIIINPGEPVSLGRRVALGIGTGLGLKDGFLLAHGDFVIGSNEMGHIGIPMPLVLDQEHRDVHHALVCKQARSFEDIISGPGMLRLHNFLYPKHRLSTPEEVGLLVRQGGARATLQYFSFYVGLFCATVQLAFMPSGGIWISGGVVAKHHEIFKQPEFFMGLNAFLAYVEERKKLPLRVMSDPDAAFMGGAYYAVKKLLAIN